MQGTAAADNVPPAARKALADMKDFLPYKSYRLLDTQWTLCCGRSMIATRLRGPEDYALVTRRLLETLVSQNVQYAEITLSAGVVLWKEQEFGPIFEAVRREAAQSPVDVQWNLDAIRHFGAEHAMQVAELAAEYVDDGVVSFGIGGNEERGPTASRVIFLASENPVARRIYERLGFLSFPRGLMRRERPPDEMFDEQWFRPGQLSIRLVHPGDTPRLVALYSAPSQWLSVASPQGLYSAGRVTHDRCNSLVKHTWVATRAGAWFAMANAEGALVGSGPMEPRGNEREPLGAEIDIFVHPAFVDHAGLLLARMVQEGSERGWRWLIAQLGDDDTQKRELLEATGFREVVRLADALSFGGTRQGLRILRMELGGG